MPTVSEEVVKLPVAPDRVAVPKVVAESRNVTVPVGVFEPVFAVTVAVYVTAWPEADGFTELVTVAVLESRLTVWVIAAEVLAVKFVSPLYETVIV